MKPDAASLPPVLILASGFLLLLAIATLAANPGLLLPEPAPEQGDAPDGCDGPTPAQPDPATPTPRATCEAVAHPVAA